MLNSRPSRSFLLCSLLIVAGFVSLSAQGQPAQEQSAQEEGTVLRGHLGPVLMGVLTPEASRGITVSSDETVRLWDLKTRQELRSYPGHTGPLFCVDISKNGRTLATGAQDNTLRIWDVPPVKPLLHIPAHSGGTNALCLSQNGEMLLTGGLDNTARLWNAVTLVGGGDPGKLAANAAAGVRTGPETEVTATAIRNDGNLIATGDKSGWIRLHGPYVEGTLQTLGQHAGGVTGLAFTANNQQLISAGNDGSVRVWQLQSAAQRPRQIPGEAVTDLVVFSNQAIAIVSTPENVVRSINLTSGQTLKEFPKGTGKVTSIALALNNTLLAVADDQGKVRMFNVADAAPRGELQAHTKAVHDVTFHPDSQSLFTAGADGVVARWKLPDPNAKEPEQPLHSWPNVQTSVLTVSRDGAKLFGGGIDGKIRQWKLSDGALERTLAGHQGNITALDVLPNGQQLLSGGADKTVKQWNLADGMLVRSTTHTAAVRGLSITSDSARFLSSHQNGETLLREVISGDLQETQLVSKTDTVSRWLNDNQSIVSGSTEKNLHIWRQSALRSFSPHQQGIRDLTLYNGGTHVVSVTDGGTVVLTDMNSGQPTRTFEGLSGETGRVACRFDNQRIAAGSSEKKVLIWNAGNGELLQTLEVPGGVTSLAFSPDNQKLAITTTDKSLLIFGRPNPAQTPQPGNELVLHQQATTENIVTRVVFHRDNRSVWTTDAEGNLSHWAYASPVQVRQFNHGGPVYGVAVGHDGKLVVSCSADRTVRIFDTPTGQQKASMTGHQGAVHAVAISPDESLIVSSGADRTVRLWDVAGGRQLKQLATFDETMYSVSIHPDGQTVAVGGADRKVHLINLLTGELVRTLEGHTDYIHRVTFNPKGTRLLSYGYAGQLRVWDVATGKPVYETRLGRIGNFACYSADGTQVLLSNGDATARVVDLPAQAQ